MLLGATVIQWSAAIVQPVFHAVGPSAAAGWRFLLGAVALFAITRPRLGEWRRAQWSGVAVLGCSIAFMSECFYQAIARIPLGGAVAIEYLGPLLVAALTQRSGRHFAFVGLAGAGVYALARPGSGLTITGLAFAAGAGAGWASYAFASARVGGVTKGLDGLAVSMGIAAILTLPFSIGSLHEFAARPHLLIRMVIVAVLWAVIGMGAELQSLRRLAPSVVSVLLALDPAVAFLVGWLLLRQSVSAWDLVGLVAVVVAGMGVTYDAASEDVAVAL